MKLVTFQASKTGEPQPGLLTPRGVVALAGAVRKIAGHTPSETMCAIIDAYAKLKPALARLEKSGKALPLSKVKRGLAEVLKREGYIWDWEEIPGEPANQIRLHLKYGPNGERVIRHVRRVSSPGRRVFSGATKLKPILGGMGIVILSTSRGVISDREARQRNLGGEVLCEIW